MAVLRDGNIRGSGKEQLPVAADGIKRRKAGAHARADGHIVGEEKWHWEW